MVGGKREEEEYWIGGATEDGEVGVVYAGEADIQGPSDRRPGKLYVSANEQVWNMKIDRQGKSLMDQLEARKSALKGKQR